MELVWTDDSEAIGAPAEYLEWTTELALRTEKLASEHPLWIRKRLGLSGRLPDLAKYDEEYLQYNFNGSLPEPQNKVNALISAYSQICDLTQGGTATD